MSLNKYLICLCLLPLLAGSCRNSKVSMTPTQEQIPLDFSAGPPTVVYKTKHDYTDKVAVTLNADETEIVAYPHPRDISKRGNAIKPTVLAQGYLLDNQGLNERAAFTRYTFAEYAALTKVPSLTELKASIIDKEPFVEICHCGNRNQFKTIEADLNRLIAQKLVPCQTITTTSKPE
jgi:hypothetical protein